MDHAGRILVVGGGKAGAAMAAGVEAALHDRLDRVSGVVNVPEGAVRPLRSVRLHAGRPAGVNHPTAAGVAGVEDMLDLVSAAGPDDLGLCLLSGGGSALLPAPVEGVSLEDKQRVTALLHACGATIDEMNCVRKHLSRFKGGRLAQAFAERGCPVYSLIISDVIGDPLDVIASGPTAADPTTFADAIAVLDRHGLTDRTPPAVLDHLRTRRGRRRPRDAEDASRESVHNLVLGNNARRPAPPPAGPRNSAIRCSTSAPSSTARRATSPPCFAGIVRSIRADGRPLRPPVCVLSGGETTVTLTEHHGKGGRNQEFVLAAALKLGAAGLRNMVVLSGGTDGEDGPTDAAGAVADGDTFARAAALHLDRRGLPGAPRRLSVFSSRRRPAPDGLDANQRHGRARDPDRGMNLTERCGSGRSWRGRSPLPW